MVKAGVSIRAVVFLLMGTLGISTAFGMVLLMPLYVDELGGNEADFGVILSSATIPAMLCIGALIRYPELLRPNMVVAIAMAAYAAGILGVTLTTDSWTPLVGVGVLLGTAWAVVYTATPMAMSEMVTDEGRATYFGYLTGTQQVGIGAGPVVAGQLMDNGLGYRRVFLLAALICLVAVISTTLVGRLGRGAQNAEEMGSPVPVVIDVGAAVRRIMRSEAVFPLIMILLFACLFTSMTQFQTTFAAARGLDYPIFYIAYTGAVIFSRFVLARIAGRFEPRLVVALSVSVLAVAIASFLLVGASAITYALASAFMGLGYGLALPAVQAQAVNVSNESVRPRVLPIAGLLFQAAILSFPLAAGAVITGLGYDALFGLLVSLALVQAGIGWWRLLRSERGGSRWRPTGVRTS